MVKSGIKYSEVIKLSVIVGIDIGGSTTKIVGFDREKNLIKPMLVRATDPITSVYGAFGKFTSENGLDIEDIDRVMITGVGSTQIRKPIYGLKCVHVSEFECVGLGGLYLSHLDRAVIVSMGTGTSITYGDCSDGKFRFEYLGGTGVGGGIVMGLSKQLLSGVSNIDSIVELAASGDVGHVDLQIKEMTDKDFGLPANLTAANFGKVDDLATRGDLAAGLLNMVFETAAMIARFAARSCNTSDIVLTGNLTTIPQCAPKFEQLCDIFGENYIIPENSEYATVIGAALLSDAG